MKTDPKETIAVLDSLTIKILFIVSTLITGAFFSALFVSAHIDMFRLGSQNALLLWALPIVPLSIYATAHISWEYLNTTLLKAHIKQAKANGSKRQKLLNLLGTNTYWMIKQLGDNSSKEKEITEKVASILQKSKDEIEAKNEERDKTLAGLVDDVDDIENEFEKETIHKYFAKIVIKFSLIVLASLVEIDPLPYKITIGIVILLLHIDLLRLTVRLLVRMAIFFVRTNYGFINERLKMWWYFKGIKRTFKKSRLLGSTKHAAE